jgi:hypothetical protein
MAGLWQWQNPFYSAVVDIGFPLKPNVFLENCQIFLNVHA